MVGTYPTRVFWKVTLELALKRILVVCFNIFIIGGFISSDYFFPIFIFLAPKNIYTKYIFGDPEAHSTTQTDVGLMCSRYSFIIWKGVRVVECARLESVCTATYRKFKSCPFRQQKSP